MIDTHPDTVKCAPPWGPWFTVKEVSGISQSAARNTIHTRAFKVGVETDEIAIEAIDHAGDILACHGGVGHIVGEGSRRLPEDRVSEREESEVSTNVVRGRV